MYKLLFEVDSLGGALHRRNHMRKEWTVQEPKDWLRVKCMRSPGEELRIPLFEKSPPDMPPATPLLKAFRQFAKEGIISGTVVRSDNAGPIAIGKVMLTQRAIQDLEKQRRGMK